MAVHITKRQRIRAIEARIDVQKARKLSADETLKKLRVELAAARKAPKQ